MKVYDQGNKINVYGDIHVADLSEFFGQHEVLTDPNVDAMCNCGSVISGDWIEHITVEFIAWVTNL